MSENKSQLSSAFERIQPIHHDFLDIPLIGRVHPSRSANPGENYELSDLIHNSHNIQHRVITLEVLDNAMSYAGIFKGDFLTVDLDATPDNNDLAVIKLGERIFVRRFFKQDTRIRLETASDYPSTLVIEHDTPNFAILGKVQSLTRHL
jgi:SOS-response transcriptional repressor LexA